MFELIFLILTSGYFLISAILIHGVKKNFSQLSDDQLPSISIIVAARNEEQNIEGCLQSLNNLVYPEGKIEILIVDDASTDNTLTIASNFIHGKQKFRIIHLKEDEQTKLKGKVRAMSEGIKNTRGEIILTTDADCAVEPLWAKTIASYYFDTVGIVNGFTSQITDGAFSGMQAIDFIYLFHRTPYIGAGDRNPWPLIL